MPKTIHDITDSNLEKDNEILIVFFINISYITGHQMAFKFPAHLTSVTALPGETEQMQHEIKKTEFKRQ